MQYKIDLWWDSGLGKKVVDVKDIIGTTDAILFGLFR